MVFVVVVVGGGGGGGGVPFRSGSLCTAAVSTQRRSPSNLLQANCVPFFSDVFDFS